MKCQWRLEQTEDALQDSLNIIHWTLQNFGERQAEIYSETIALALEALEAGPNTLGVKKRETLGTNLYTLHVARKERKGRHFIVFRVVEPNTLEVLRLLHDSMDLEAHLVK